MTPERRLHLEQLRVKIYDLMNQIERRLLAEGNPRISMGLRQDLEELKNQLPDVEQELKSSSPTANNSQVNEIPHQSNTSVSGGGNPRLTNLIASLNDLDIKIRRQAAKTLGQIREIQTMEALIQALRDSDEEVRWRSAFALGEIGDAKALDALKELVGKGNSTPMDWLRVQLTADKDAARVAIKRIKKANGLE